MKVCLYILLNSYCYQIIVPLERGAEHEADAPTLRVAVDRPGGIQIGQAAHILHVDDLENVVDTHDRFHIGRVSIHHAALLFITRGREA